MGGIEPPMTGSKPVACTTWLHPNAGWSGRHRTGDLSVISRMLCHWATLQYLVGRDGLEPPTRGFSVPCSTNWATDPNGLRPGSWTLWCSFTDCHPKPSDSPQHRWWEGCDSNTRSRRRLFYRQVVLSRLPTLPEKTKGGLFRTALIFASWICQLII